MTSAVSRLVPLTRLSRLKTLLGSSKPGVLSGREVVVAGSGDGSSFVVHDDPERTLTLHAVTLDHRTLKARLDASGTSLNMLLIRRINIE